MSNSSFYSNTGTTTASISSITTLNAAATASKDAAAVSAANAATSATASEVSNAAALVSKNSAASSATTASGHKDTATTQAALATTNGADQVTLATAQVALATTQATNSASSATAAASSATSASSSASSATSSASTATTKASEASTSASEAAAYLDLFTDQYLGAKSSAPTVDNDGDALTNGDLYFDTTSNSMQVWNGSAWGAAYISAAGMAALSGATFTGNITVPNLLTAGNVDGRDVSADGTKLDGIEASADVTDSTNVSAAGALMDSEVTNLADVKAFDPADYASAAVGSAALPKAGGTMTGDVIYNDNVEAVFGTGNDLQIYHDGTGSIIRNNTGDLNIYGDSSGGNYSAIRVKSGSGNAVSLKYANSTKLETTSTGVSMSNGAAFGSFGHVALTNYLNSSEINQVAILRYFQVINKFQSGLTDGSYFGGLEFVNSRVGSGISTGSTGYVRGVANGTAGNMNLEIVTGTAGSLTTKILVKDAGVDITGDLDVTGTVTATGTSVFATLDISGDVDVAGTTNLDVVDIDGAVNMATTALVTGVLTTTAMTVHTGGISMPDNARARFGTGGDLEIWHQGNTNFIQSNIGPLYIKGTNLYLADPSGHHYIAMTDTGTGGTVEIKHNAVTKLATTATGISITGTLNATTVDLGNWTLTESGGVLFFATGGTNKMKLDASGNLICVGDVTAFGTV